MFTLFFFFQAEDGIRDLTVTGVQTCALPIWLAIFGKHPVTAFKLLDMLVEWVLAENGKPATYKFVQKIAVLKGLVKFPPLMDTRPWLRDRLVALYDKLEPLRGTIIHAPHFKAAGGALRVSSSKGGAIGPLVTIVMTDLRNLA